MGDGREGSENDGLPVCGGGRKVMESQLTIIKTLAPIWRRDRRDGTLSLSLATVGKTLGWNLRDPPEPKLKPEPTWEDRFTSCSFVCSPIQYHVPPSLSNTTTSRRHIR